MLKAIRGIFCIYDDQAMDSRLTLKIDQKIFNFLIEYVTKRYDLQTGSHIQRELPKVKAIAMALQIQAQDNFDLFHANFTVLEKSDTLLKLFATLILETLVFLSKDKPNIYNIFIKKLVQADFLNDTLKIQCLKLAISYKNADLTLWLFSPQGGLHLETPIEKNYPILLYLASRFEKENIEFLLNLKTEDDKALFQPKNINFEVLTHYNSLKGDYSIRHSALEFVLKGHSFNTEIVSLLRMHGATNFSSLDDRIKEQFLKWEQEQLSYQKEEPEMKKPLEYFTRKIKQGA